MSINAILFGWNRSLPGREAMSAQHFQDFTQYLQARQASGDIDSFEPLLIQPHGGELNGFFYIRGEPARLAALTASPEWIQHQIRATLHLDGVALLRGVTGSAVAEYMALWVQATPR
jgi:hypothetical protein